MKIISALVSIAKAIPIIQEWVKKVLLMYEEWKAKEEKKQTAKDVDLGIKEQDQRKLEDENHSGQYSGRGDIRSSLPGVMRDKKKGERLPLDK